MVVVIFVIFALSLSNSWYVEAGKKDSRNIRSRESYSKNTKSDTEKFSDKKSSSGLKEEMVFKVDHLNSFTYWSKLFEQEIPYEYTQRVVADIEKRAIPLDPNGRKFEVDYSRLLMRNTKEISFELTRLSKSGIFGSQPTVHDTYCHIAVGYCFVFPRAETQKEFMCNGVALRLEDGAVIKWNLNK